MGEEKTKDRKISKDQLVKNILMEDARRSIRGHKAQMIPGTLMALRPPYQGDFLNILRNQGTEKE